jgi:hypothetical protein
VERVLGWWRVAERLTMQSQRNYNGVDRIEFMQNPALLESGP